MARMSTRGVASPVPPFCGRYGSWHTGQVRLTGSRLHVFSEEAAPVSAHRAYAVALAYHHRVGGCAERGFSSQQGSGSCAVSLQRREHKPVPAAHLTFACLTQDLLQALCGSGHLLPAPLCCRLQGSPGQVQGWGSRASQPPHPTSRYVALRTVRSYACLQLQSSCEALSYCPHIK
jgi:hypothetical protein